MRTCVTGEALLAKRLSLEPQMLQPDDAKKAMCRLLRTAAAVPRKPSMARRPMVELLFARLPHTMRVRAISRLARFVTTNTLPSVTQEAAILCNAAGWADPATAAAQLLAPLLEQLEAELPGLERLSLNSNSSAEVSKV